MDLIDKLRELALRAPAQLPHLTTEEATKNALVMPLIGALGYNVFDPTEVVPEFTADVGTKRGEKVDYAILRDSQPVMLFECKHCGYDLEEAHASQLYRYFSVTPARIGVLTNGIEYLFFSDLEQPNKMDARPFLRLDLLHLEDRTVDELKKFTKQTFNLDAIISAASELKYADGFKRILNEEWANPSEEMVRLLVGRVYTGRFTQGVREQFTEIVKQALHEFINRRVNERLQAALERSDGLRGRSATADEMGDGREVEVPSIVTTEDELQGFYVVKAIISSVMNPRRVFMRDTQSYCGILIDDNNRKPVCRLRFNASKKHIGLFDEAKSETRHAINDISDLYTFTDHLRRTAERYSAQDA